MKYYRIWAFHSIWVCHLMLVVFLSVVVFWLATVLYDQLYLRLLVTSFVLTLIWWLMRQRSNLIASIFWHEIIQIHKEHICTSNCSTPEKNKHTTSCIVRYSSMYCFAINDMVYTNFSWDNKSNENRPISVLNWLVCLFFPLFCICVILQYLCMYSIWLGKPILYLSHMTRDMTRLTCHKGPGIWLS